MYMIKPLVWATNPKRPHSHIAYTIFGDIQIDDAGHDVYVSVMGEEATHKNLNDAKTYARTWYHNRIREALEYVGQGEATTLKSLPTPGDTAKCWCGDLCGTCESRVCQALRDCVDPDRQRKDRVLWSGAVMIVVMLNWWVTCSIFIQNLGWGFFISLIIFCLGIVAIHVEESIRDFNANASASDDSPQNLQDGGGRNVGAGRTEMVGTQPVDKNEPSVNATNSRGVWCD